jgi:uncharacterized protein (TIGR02246 family)
MVRMTPEELRADLEIRALVARYCHAIAHRDDDAWADTFAKDGEWVVLGRTARGRDEALALYRKLVAGFPWIVQVATNGIVEVHGDTATGRWIITEYLQRQDGVPGVNVGVYRDSYRRCEDGRWRFARRVFTPTYLGPADLTGKTLPLPPEA